LQQLHTETLSHTHTHTRARARMCITVPSVKKVRSYIYCTYLQTRIVISNCFLHTLFNSSCKNYHNT